MKRAVGIFCALVVVFTSLLSHQLGHFRAGDDVTSDMEDTGYEYYSEEDIYDEGEEEMSVKATAAPKKKLIEVDTKEDSYTVLVNRKYPMSRDYVPADLVVPRIRFSFYGTYEKSYVRQVTASALEQLFTAGQKKGIILKGVSGYRSYARQQEIYNAHVLRTGVKSTDLVSAKPGTSEHQTGLSIDVSSESVGCALEESFGSTAEGKWLAKNCHKYGFIIRYPKDKTEITGYSYEPWHIRYVGKKLATYLYKKGLTLEEYYQTTTVDEKIVEPQTPVQDVVDEEDEVEEPQMTSAPTPIPTPRVTEKAKATKKPVATKKPTAKPKPTKKPAATTETTENSTPETVPETPEVTPEVMEPASQEPVTQEPAATTAEETPAGQDIPSEEPVE